MYSDSRDESGPFPNQQQKSKVQCTLTCLQLSESEKENSIEKRTQRTSRIYEGLDLQKEIKSVDVQKLGDSIMILDPSDKLVGLAIRHVGAGTEAGSGNCYFKCGAVESDDSSGQLFSRLLDCVHDYALSKQTSRMIEDVNMARQGAYKTMMKRGFRTELKGVAMHNPNAQGYNRPDIYLIDNWR